MQGLREEQGLTTKDWQSAQMERLRRVLVHARSLVPYYRKNFQEFSFEPSSSDLPTDLNRVPLLTKGIIREHLHDLLADNVNPSALVENATGGSTGVPLKFYQDSFYQTVSMALDSFVRKWWGIRPFDRTAVIWGADREFRDLSFKERLYVKRTRTKSLNAFRMTDENLLGFCKMLERWKPPYLMGYSSALEALGNCAKNHGMDNLEFKAIRSAAEMLYPRQRKTIQQTLKGPVYNFYASREVNNIAAECPEEKQLHLISTWRFVEIVDKKGNRLPNGDIGYIAVTDLSNYSMPFIRYLNGDMAKLSRQYCPCGRPSPIIEDLLGRSSDIIKSPAGELIHGEWFTHLFYGRDDIKQFQVRQTDLNHITLRYVSIGQPPKEFIRLVTEKIQQRMGRDVIVEAEKCESIAVPESGKYRFTISDVS